MIEQQLIARLALGAEDLGLDAWAVARRADLPEGFVASVLAGETQVAVETLVVLASALELEVRLEPVEPARRVVGSVPSVVDRAIERIAPGPSVHVNDGESPRGAEHPSSDSSAPSSTR